MLNVSELANIREALEKFTTGAGAGEALGLGRAAPGLATGELDDEVDMSVGRQAFIV